MEEKEAIISLLLLLLILCGLLWFLFQATTNLVSTSQLFLFVLATLNHWPLIITFLLGEGPLLVLHTKQVHCMYIIKYFYIFPCNYTSMYPWHTHSLFRFVIASSRQGCFYAANLVFCSIGPEANSV